MSLQTQAGKLVNEQGVGVFTGYNKNGELIWEFECRGCTPAEVLLVRILLAGYILEEYTRSVF